MNSMIYFLLQAFSLWYLSQCNIGFIFISLKEGKQLSTVLNYPAFQLDPLAAIHQHLQSTQPVLDEKPKKKKNKNGGRKKKAKKSKASDGPQSMVMWNKLLSIYFYKPYLFRSDPESFQYTFWIRNMFTWLTTLSGFILFQYPRDALSPINVIFSPFDN